jgi:hypothetical protein
MTLRAPPPATAIAQVLSNGEIFISRKAWKRARSKRAGSQACAPGCSPAQIFAISEIHARMPLRISGMTACDVQAMHFQHWWKPSQLRLRRRKPKTGSRALQGFEIKRFGFLVIWSYLVLLGDIWSRFALFGLIRRLFRVTRRARPAYFA